MVGIWVFDLTKNFDDHPWAGERLGFEGDEQEKKPFDMILGLQNELPQSNRTFVHGPETEIAKNR